MAGIGFNLQKILEGDSIISSVRAHFYSTLICAGPWLLSIFTIFCISFFAPENLDLYEIIFFRTSLIYIFAGSLIGIGFLHFPLTRYLADRLYLKESDRLVPIFNSSTVFVFLIQGIMGLCLFLPTHVDWQIKVLGILTCQVIGFLWLIMIFLTSLKDYNAIVGAYALGSVVAIYSALYLGRIWGLSGYFFGYWFGHVVIAVLWSARMFIEFSSNKIFDVDFFPFLMRHGTLLCIGLFYNIAIWIDKIMFWISPNATVIDGIFRTFPTYESATFVAYMTIIPGLSIFLIQIETEFYKEYRRYYMSIMEKASYEVLRSIHESMMAQLRHSAAILIRYQGLFSLLVITFAPQIIGFCNLPLVLVPAFRVAVVGAFLHCILLMVLIIILYFDFQKVALVVSTIFLVTQGVFNYITTLMPMPYHGYGYVAASLVTLMSAYYFLDFRLYRLEYYTFALQPLGTHRQEEIF